MQQRLAAHSREHPHPFLAGWVAGVLVAAMSVIWLAPSPASAATPPPGRVVGLVHNATAGLPGIQVWLTTPTNSLVSMQKSDANGNYVFASVAPGKYVVAFSDPARQYAHGAFWPDAPDFRDATVIDVAAGTTMVADQRLYLPADQPIVPYAGAAGGPTVAVLGDSITEMSTYAIDHALAPSARVSVQGIALQRIGQLQPSADKYAAAGSPNQVVIALGTNDAIQQWPVAQSEADLDAMISTFPSAACVNVLTINDHTGSSSTNTEAATLNSYIRGLRPSHPRVQIVEWEQVVARYLAAGQPQGTWTTDGVHLNYTGQAVYADLMTAAVNNCNKGSSSIAGSAFFDANANNIRDGHDQGLPRVAITLSGVSVLGATVNLAVSTGPVGGWSYANLTAGTYQVTQTPPPGYQDGQEQSGTAGGAHSPNTFGPITLAPATTATNYNFADRA